MEQLLERVDLVFTGGYSLWEAKRDRHRSVHAFPSSVDSNHFAAARNGSPEPLDQVAIPRPRLGFFGAIDERMDLALIAELAATRPDFQLVLVGPVVKIPEESLPRGPNIHWLGRKSYEELPAYLAGWDVALMPFALNDATRFISPTNTLEYLAGGKPVVSTSIADVVRPYGQIGLVHIAAPHDFARTVDAALASDASEHARVAKAFVQQTSWDATWAEMNALIEVVLASRGGAVMDLQEIASCSTI